MATPFRAGGAGIPLTPDEIAMAQTLADAIAGASNISLEEISSILSNLTPIELERLLNSITIFSDQAQIQQSLLNSINIGGNEAMTALHALAPNLRLDAFGVGGAGLANMNFGSTLVLPAAPSVRFNLFFNKTNPNSLAFAQSRAGELVTSIDELTRLSIRNIISKGFAEQIDVRVIASQIKNVIGLHPQWADAVVNFQKRETARLLQTGLNDIKARSQVALTTERYANRLKSARATMVARTEVQIANNQGRWEGYQQAADAGFVDVSWTKTWITAKDERTCDRCAPLNGETVGFEDMFSNGLLTPIVHPNCRCQFVLNPPNRGTR